MAVCRGDCGLLIILAIAGCCFGQQNTRNTRQDPSIAPAKVSLVEISTAQIPTLPAESVAGPLSCDPAGRIVFRLATPETGVKDPVSVSRDGRSVIRFGQEKINDISEPVLLRMFVAGSDVYILVRGTVPVNGDLKLRTPSGKVITEQATEHRTFISRFEGDGRYAGAVHLDLPFEPHQIGVFANGDFLVAGAEPRSYEPRAAIVGSNGQLRWFVELKGDVHGEEESDAPGNDKDPTALPRFKPWKGNGLVESLRGVVMTSQITQDGPNLLLYRPWNGPIFSISSSGETTVHRLKVAGEYRLFTVKPERDSWTVEFVQELAATQQIEFATFAFDRETGKPLRQYFFPGDFGWGLACTDGDEFTFVVANPGTNTLKLVTLSPSGN